MNVWAAMKKQQAVQDAQNSELPVQQNQPFQADPQSAKDKGSDNLWGLMTGQGAADFISENSKVDDAGSTFKGITRNPMNNSFAWQGGSLERQLGPMHAEALGLPRDSFVAKAISPWNMVFGTPKKTNEKPPPGFGEYDQSPNQYFDKIRAMRSY